MKKKSKKVVMVSGGFDPVHIGHVRLFEEAKKLGDELVVVINNDNWLHFKKGYAFMPEADRQEIIKSFRAVDRVLLTSHEQNTKDITVCRELELLRPHIFAVSPFAKMCGREANQVRDRLLYLLYLVHER